MLQEAYNAGIEVQFEFPFPAGVLVVCQVLLFALQAAQMYALSTGYYPTTTFMGTGMPFDYNTPYTNPSVLEYPSSSSSGSPVTANDFFFRGRSRSPYAYFVNHVVPPLILV